MTATTETTPTDRVGTLLAVTQTTVRDEGPAAWSLQARRHDASVSARWSEDWLQLTTGPLSPACLGDSCFLPERLLRWNSGLPGNARFAVDGRFQIALGGEVPWLEDIDPGPRVGQTWNGIEQGLDWLAGSPHPALTPVAADTTSSAAALLQPVAEATAWTFHARSDGRFDFNLEEDGSARQATVQARVDGSVRVALILASLDALSESSRRAVAVLMLRAGSVLRWARPVFDATAAGLDASLEILFARTPEPRELALALETLAVGAALTAAEVKLLCHEQTAKEFLIVGNWAPPETHQKQQTITKGQTW